MIHRGVSPWFDRAFLLVTLDLESQKPRIQLLAPDYEQGRRLDVWLATPAVRERFLEALRAELETLAGDDGEAA